MNLSLYTNYFKKCSRRLDELKILGKSKFSLWYDYLCAAIFHGCIIDQYVDGKFWMYSHSARKEIMTLRRMEKVMRICNKPEEVKLLNSKLEFNRRFSQWVTRKWLHTTEMSCEDFENFYNYCNKIIVKPLDKYEGKGIYSVLFKHTPKDLEEQYNKLSKEDLLIEECLVQHPRMVFNNASVNTIRINSLLDKDGNVHIFKAVLRVGVGDSVVDNYNAGGVEYPVDIETGIISSLGFHNNKQECIYHPMSKIVMPGYNIPFWKEVVSCVTESAKSLPLCRYIGWDVAITEKGVELIEANHNPGYVCMEYFGETGWYGKLKKYL